MMGSVRHYNPDSPVPVDAPGFIQNMRVTMSNDGSEILTGYVVLDPLEMIDFSDYDFEDVISDEEATGLDQFGYVIRSAKRDEETGLYSILSVRSEFGFSSMESALDALCINAPWKAEVEVIENIEESAEIGMM